MMHLLRALHFVSVAKYLECCDGWLTPSHLSDAYSWKLYHRVVPTVRIVHGVHRMNVIAYTHEASKEQYRVSPKSTQSSCLPPCNE